MALKKRWEVGVNSQRASKLMRTGLVLLLASVVVMIMIASGLSGLTGDTEPWYILQIVLPAAGPLVVASTLCPVGSAVVASIERGDEGRPTPPPARVTHT